MIAGQARSFPPATEILGQPAAKLRCLACASRLELVFLSEAPGYPELGADGILGCTGCCER